MLHKCLIHLFKSKHLAVVHIDIFNTALFSFVSVMFRLDPLPPAWEGGAWQGRAAGHHAQVGGGGHQARPRPPAPPLRPGVPAPDAVHGRHGLHARHVPPLPLAARGTLAQCRFVFSVTSTLLSTYLQQIIEYLHIWTFCFNCSVHNKDKLQFSNLLPFSGMSSLMSSGFAAMTPFSGQAYTQLTASAKWRKNIFISAENILSTRGLVNWLYRISYLYKYAFQVSYFKFIIIHSDYSSCFWSSFYNSTLKCFSFVIA